MKSYRTVVLYIRLRIYCPKRSSQNQLYNNYFVTSRQYWLGIGKLKNVLRLTIDTPPPR